MHSVNEKNTYLALSHCVVSSFLQKYIKKCCFSNSSHLIVCAIFFQRIKGHRQKIYGKCPTCKTAKRYREWSTYCSKVFMLSYETNYPIYCWWTSKYFVNFFSHPAFTALYRKCEKKYWHHSVFSPNVGKYGPEKTPYLDTFHAVNEWTNTVNLD